MAVTVLSKSHYRAMIYDTLTIKAHTKNRIKFESHFYEQIKKLLNKHKSIFTDKEFKYLNGLITTPIFFDLPKLHKSRLITNAI